MKRYIKHMETLEKVSKPNMFYYRCRVQLAAKGATIDKVVSLKPRQYRRAKKEGWIDDQNYYSSKASAKRATEIHTFGSYLYPEGNKAVRKGSCAVYKNGY